MQLHKPSLIRRRKCRRNKVVHDVVPCGLLTWILRVVSQDNDILDSVPKSGCDPAVGNSSENCRVAGRTAQELLDVARIVDAAS
jgi:hypothetical protein